MAQITIGINRETTWKRLMQTKIDHEDLKTFDDIINFLYDNQKKVKKK